MAPKTEDPALWPAMLRAEELGFRMEIINGIGTWEFSPALLHTKAEKRIAASIRRPEGAPNDCGCHWYQDLYLRFPDGSLRRPDISIFCADPEETDQAVEQVPDAVVEVLSKGSERKDLELSPEFYLRQGVRDVVIFDPYTKIVWHYRNDRAPTHALSPVEIAFECGCVATV